MAEDVTAVEEKTAEGSHLKVWLPEGIILVVIVKHPGEEALVLPIEIQDPRELVEDFRTVWDDLGDKTRNAIIRGLV